MTSAVTDNGIGIEPRFARSIIEVFKRLHNRKEFPGPASASLFASASSNGTVSAVAMQVMWDEVARAVSPGTHAVST